MEGKTMRKIEICSNTEWLFVFGPLEETDPDSYETQQEQSIQWSCEVERRIEKQLTGVECVCSRGQRAMCHGWNGANTFTRKGRGLGTFDEFTDKEWLALEEISTDVADEIEEEGRLEQERITAEEQAEGSAAMDKTPFLRITRNGLATRVSLAEAIDHLSTSLCVPDDDQATLDAWREQLKEGRAINTLSGVVYRLA
jgi:hypothetical protein